jgi:AcrR family transcriptional regulator
MVLQDSLIELLEEKAISKITVKELCEKADINRTTFYTHYANPGELLATIEGEALIWANERITDLLGRSDHKEAIPILEEIFTYLIENGDHIKVLMSERGDIGFQKKLFELIYAACDFTPPTSRAKDDELREYYLVFAVSGSVGLIQKWLKDGLNKSAKEMAEIIYSMTYSVHQYQA